MWAFQDAFRLHIEQLTESVFKKLGIDPEIKTVVVGVRRPETPGRNPVCIEPEDSEWALSLFDGIVDRIEAIFQKDPAQRMFYENDERAMRDKPENIRRASVRTGVQAVLEALDSARGVTSFFGSAGIVGEYHVVPVIQVPSRVFELFPSLPQLKVHPHYTTSPGFIHTCMHYVLDEAFEEMARSEPGRLIGWGRRSAGDIIRLAATSFMRTPVLAIRDKDFNSPDFFSFMNDLSSLLYEGTSGAGRLLLIAPDNPAIRYAIRLKSSVHFRDARWARKILQMSSPDLSLIANGTAIHGLGTLDPNHDASQQDAFWIEFIDHFHWHLRLGDRVLLRTHFGEAMLPQEPVARPRFLDNFLRLFPSAQGDDADRFWGIVVAMDNQPHGSMIVVANDAAIEAARLSRQGMSIEPMLLTPELLGQVSKIDGSILIDPSGLCHAVGVILDGIANEQCKPSRGSRYNSAVRYISTAINGRMAVVRSSDRTTEIIPLLRPRIEREKVEAALRALETATVDNYRKPRKYLDDKRFYLTEEQCRRANAALERIRSGPREAYSIFINTMLFEYNPDLNDGYFL
jgi:hypothetical protein